MTARAVGKVVDAHALGNVVDVHVTNCFVLFCFVLFCLTGFDSVLIWWPDRRTVQSQKDVNLNVRKYQLIPTLLAYPSRVMSHESRVTTLLSHNVHNYFFSRYHTKIVFLCQVLQMENLVSYDMLTFSLIRALVKEPLGHNLSGSQKFCTEPIEKASWRPKSGN
jgi:hypothetical protein